MQELQDIRGNASDIAAGPAGNGRLRQIVRHDRHNIADFSGQACFTDRGSPHFDFRAGVLQMPFGKHEVAIGIEWFQAGIKIVLGIPGAINADHFGGDDCRRIRSRKTVPIGIFAWLIQIVCVAAMLDGTHSQPATVQFRDQFEHQCRFAVIFSAYDVEEFHGDVLPQCKMIN
jgi:hypothetical protein